jgi:N-methylhydantoinase A
MFMEVSKLVSRYGVDVRDFALLPFGGAGPMLGCFLARELGMSEVVVPTTPGVLSALGGLIADVKNDFIRSVFLDLDEAAVPMMRDVFGELRQKALTWLRDEQGFAGEPRLVYSADMRYRGQSFEIETVFDAAAVEKGDIASIGAAFHAQHKRIYEYSDAAAPVQMINLRLVAIGESPKPALKKLPASSTPPKPAETIEVWFDGATSKVPVFRRRELEAGQRFDGPAVVTQDDCTTCVPKGYAVEVDAYGNLRLRSTR